MSGPPSRRGRDAAFAATWSAALTAYDRCFARGKKFGLTTDDVKSLPLEGQVVKFHEWAVGERNILGKHPTNPFDEARVGAVLAAPALARLQPSQRRPATSWSTGPGSGSWARSPPSWPSRPPRRLRSRRAWSRPTPSNWGWTSSTP